MRAQPTAVLFDLDDTLLVDLACIQRVLRETCDIVSATVPGVDGAALAAAVRRHAKARKQESPYLDFCERVGIASWEILAADFDADAPLHDALRTWASVYRLQVWTGALREAGVEDASLAVEVARDYANRRRRAYELFDDVVPCLDELGRTGVPFAIVTNGPADLQREKIARTALAGRAAAVVVSGDLGVGKPDPLPLRLALDRLGVEAAAAVMVGDARHRDVAAAQAAGVRSVWLSRPGHPTGHGPAADVTVAGLANLLAALA